MKTKLVIILTSLFSIFSFSQSDYNIVGVSVDKYTDSIVKKEFSIKFNTEKKRTSFKDLREFLAEKEAIMSSLKYEILNNSKYSKFIKLIDKKLEKFKAIASKIKGSDKTFKLDFYDIEIPGNFYLEQDYGSEAIEEGSAIEYNSEDMELLIKNFESAKMEFVAKDAIAKNLRKNLENVKQDIFDCRQQLDSTLAPEYKKQEFATNISICFTIIIGILLISFFYIIYKRSDMTLSKDLLSGYGLQFITLFVLIIAIILFGILGILQSSELAAILSGISGYILGKGIQDKKSIGLEQTTVTNPEGSTTKTKATSPSDSTTPAELKDQNTPAKSAESNTLTTKKE